MAFQYTFRAFDIASWESSARDLVENRDLELELYIATIDTSLALKADIASPTFTGTPTLPTGTIATTQTAGNSTTAVATTAFVTTADNLKANLASPTFTGTPTLPTGTIATTQTAGNNTTAVATTAFVNRLPFGVAYFDSNASNYTLTTTLTAVTGLGPATWTADSTRLYKITYYEPQCQTSTAASYINLQLRQTNAAGTALQSTFVQNETAVSTTTGQTCTYIGTFASGSVTVVPCALTSTITGNPRLSHSATTRSFILVEDVGLN